jgi:hypothetical protein
MNKSEPTGHTSLRLSPMDTKEALFPAEETKKRRKVLCSTLDAKSWSAVLGLSSPILLPFIFEDLWKHV